MKIIKYIKILVIWPSSQVISYTSDSQQLYDSSSPIIAFIILHSSYISLKKLYMN